MSNTSVHIYIRDDGTLTEVRANIFGTKTRTGHLASYKLNKVKSLVETFQLPYDKPIDRCSVAPDGGYSTIQIAISGKVQSFSTAPPCRQNLDKFLTGFVAKIETLATEALKSDE